LTFLKLLQLNLPPSHLPLKRQRMKFQKNIIS